MANGSNTLIQESLQCSTATLVLKLYQKVHDRELAATTASVMMGANYTSILKSFGCCGVPVLLFKHLLELARQRSHATHTFNSKTTPSYLFKAANPVADLGIEKGGFEMQMRAKRA